MSNQEQWNQFIKQNKGSFLQSWQWGQLQESMNRKIWRVETDGLKGLIIKHDLSLGKNYLYCPHGPTGQGNIKNFLEQIKQIAYQEKSIFFKLEPNVILSVSEGSRKSRGYHEILRLLTQNDNRWEKSQKEIQFAKTIILDITKSEQELLEQMHPKTRYNIRLAEKKGIEIEQSNTQESLDVFLNLLKQTGQRDKFFLHPQEYYQKMLDILGESMAKLFLAKYKNQIIAVNLVCFFNQTAVYLHGASDYNHRQLMAPYLLQWQTILQAKQQGLKYYDFWGIDEGKWPGVTRFKKGFNGQEIIYPGAYDSVYQSVWYRIYNLARRAL